MSSERTDAQERRGGPVWPIRTGARSHLGTVVAAQAASEVGTWLAYVALAVVVYDRTHSAGWVSVLLLLDAVAGRRWRGGGGSRGRDGCGAVGGGRPPGRSCTRGC